MGNEFSMGDLILPAGILIIFIIFLSFISFSLFGALSEKESSFNSLIVDFNAITKEKNELISIKTALEQTQSQLTSQIVNYQQSVSDLENERNQKSLQLEELSSSYNSLSLNFNKIVLDLNDTNIKFIDTNNKLFDINKLYIKNKVISNRLFSDFEDCYWAINCLSDLNGCRSRYGINIDLNIVPLQIGCQTVDKNDLNEYVLFFR